MADRTMPGAPDPVELLEFFGREPLEAVPEDGYWSYEVADDSGTRLRFSFDLLEASVQLVLLCDGYETAVVSQEGLVSLSLAGGALKVATRTGEAGSNLQITIAPRIQFTWTTLFLG
jgi:hypothetical protein